MRFCYLAGLFVLLATPLMAQPAQSPSTRIAKPQPTNAQLQLEQSAQAAEFYEKQVKLEPTSALAHKDLAFAYLNLHRFADSEKSFLEALRLDPALASAFRGLCITYSGLNRPERALDYCLKAEADFSDAAVEYVLDLAYLDLGRYQESIASLRKGLAMDPAEVKILIALGEANYKLGRYQEALQNFTTAARQQPGLSEVHIDIAACYFRLRQYTEAQRLLNRAIALNPSSVAAHSNLAATCLQTRQRGCVLTEYNALKSLDPASAHYLFTELFGGRLLDADAAAKPKHSRPNRLQPRNKRDSVTLPRPFVTFRHVACFPDYQPASRFSGRVGWLGPRWDGLVHLRAGDGARAARITTTLGNSK